MGSVGTDVMRFMGKGKRKSPLRAGLPRNVRSMSKEVLEATLQKKRECNAKAQKIVESLLEKDIKVEWFLDCLKFINDTHFQDVNEERAISSLCGYPLCDGALKNVPNQQYKICTAQNKVYDITERKNFCSNHCYKASKYLKDQLLTSPLWLRDKEEIPEFKLLSVSPSGGMVGEEVTFGQQESLRDEVTQIKESSNKNLAYAEERRPTYEEICETEIEINDSASASSVKECTCPGGSESGCRSCFQMSESTEASIQEKSEATDVTSVKKSVCSGGEICRDLESQSNFSTIVRCLPEEVGSESNKASVQSKKVGIQKRERRKSKEKCVVTEEFQDNKQAEAPVTTMLVEKCLREWFTLDSMYYLFGEAAMREMVADRDITHYYKPPDSDSWDPGMRQRYIAICKKLNLMELEDISYDSKITNENKELRPLPEYSSVKEEGMKMQLKVRAFYAGRTAYEDVSTEDGSQDSEHTGNFLPLVDLHSRNALRRRIVLDRFNRILPDLLSAFGISSSDISDDLRSLVFSFCLSAHNITFKPTEWNLLGLIVLKMLSIKDKRIKSVLGTEQARKYMTMMLMVYQEDAGYLDRLMAWLTDIDHLLVQHSGKNGS